MRLNEVNLDGNEQLTFRFRNVNKMLEHKELENMEMYFCPFDMEDDALEGSLNLYWKGDEILWDNLIGHYFIVFYIQYIKLICSKDEERKIPEKIEWCLLRSKLNTEDLIQELLNTPIVKLVKKMAMHKGHKVRSDELRLYLNWMHVSIIKIIGNIGSKNLYLSEDEETELNKINLNVDTNWDEMNMNGSFRLFNQIYQCYKNRLNLQEIKDWQRWLILEFPNKYFDILTEMIFPKWYIVSFCKNCTNTRNWAQYGDCNKGVCLIYRTHQQEGGGRGLRLKTCNQYSSSKGKIYQNHIEMLHNVKYSAEHPEINFFEMIGNIPGKMVEEWFHDRKGNASMYYIKQKSFEKQQWIQKYWELFKKIATSKGEAWDGLEEERVILENSILINYENDSSERKIKYDFDELLGIIWGCNMKENQKDQIRLIISKLCAENGRKEFAFYQAVKDPSKHEIWIEKEIL